MFTQCTGERFEVMDVAGQDRFRAADRHHDEVGMASAEFVELIGEWRAAGVDHFVMDFGNPASTEPILRFSEQVITPLR